MSAESSNANAALTPDKVRSEAEEIIFGYKRPHDRLHLLSGGITAGQAAFMEPAIEELNELLLAAHDTSQPDHSSYVNSATKCGRMLVRSMATLPSMHENALGVVNELRSVTDVYSPSTVEAAASLLEAGYSGPHDELLDFMPADWLRNARSPDGTVWPSASHTLTTYLAAIAKYGIDITNTDQPVFHRLFVDLFDEFDDNSQDQEVRSVLELTTALTQGGSLDATYHHSVLEQINKAVQGAEKLAVSRARGLRLAGLSAETAEYHQGFLMPIIGSKDLYGYLKDKGYQHLFEKAYLELSLAEHMEPMRQKYFRHQWLYDRMFLPATFEAMLPAAIYLYAATGAESYRADALATLKHGITTEFQERGSYSFRDAMVRLAEADYEHGYSLPALYDAAASTPTLEWQLS